MGNQLVGAAPGQIISVENYISDIADLEFDGNLGSTRFLKVCRARHQSSGLVVVKVFPIQDAGLDLKKYQEKLSDIKLIANVIHAIYHGLSLSVVVLSPDWVRRGATS